MSETHYCPACRHPVLFRQRYGTCGDAACIALVECPVCHRRPRAEMAADHGDGRTRIRLGPACDECLSSGGSEQIDTMHQMMKEEPGRRHPECVERQYLGGCICAFREPTVPLYRDAMTHLDDCPARDSGYPVGAIIGPDGVLVTPAPDAGRGGTGPERYGPTIVTCACGAVCHADEPHICHAAPAPVAPADAQATPIGIDGVCAACGAQVADVRTHPCADPRVAVPKLLAKLRAAEAERDRQAGVIASLDAGLAAGLRQVDDLRSQLAAAQRALDGGDTARIEWLARKDVDVREPTPYGSIRLFWSSPDDEGTPADLRGQIDAARRAAPADGRGEGA